MTDTAQQGPVSTAPTIPQPRSGLALCDPPPDMHLHVHLDENGRYARLHLRGELDVSTSALLDGILEDLLRSSRSPRLRHLRVETSAVTFVDAAGISPLLHARAVLARRGGVFEMPQPSPVVNRLLGLLDLTAVVRG